MAHATHLGLDVHKDTIAVAILGRSRLLLQARLELGSAVFRQWSIVMVSTVCSDDRRGAPRAIAPTALVRHVELDKRSAGADPEGTTRSRTSLLTCDPRKLLISSPLLADTIRAPRVPLYG